jgi:hypothetical protein
MDLDPRSRVSAPVPDEARLAELVKSIRDGVADGRAGLHRIFYPGACFLIRRRLGRYDVDAQVQSVLGAVFRKIREDDSVNGRNLPGLVRQILVQSFPASTNGNVGKDGIERPSVTVAARILEAMSPVERDALRRCYVLGEPPESFLNNLKLTPDQFRAIRLRARTEFSARTDHTNVA